MADGITLYFEQALTTRLLYPPEISQYIVLEETLLKDNTPLEKVDIYGCEHLLRLISIMPRILDQHFQDARKKKRERNNKSMIQGGTDNDPTDKSNTEEEASDEDDNFAQVGSIILAKLQDLARFLQKNQATLFCSRYRKKTEEELRTERKVQKRQERRMKNKSVMLLQQNEQHAEDIDVDKCV
jgi:hypothetical protein